MSFLNKRILLQLFLGGTVVSPLFSQQIGTWNNSSVSTFTNSSIGIWTNIPAAWQEIKFCPSVRDQTGLLITRSECAVPLTPNNPQTGSGVVHPGNGSEVPVPVSPVFSSRGLHRTSLSTPLVTINPLLWLRTEDRGTNGIITGYDTRLMVLPNGKVGINSARPRAFLEVRSEGGVNEVAALFGQISPGSNGADALSKLPDYATRHLMVVPLLGKNSFNHISQSNDLGLFYTDGSGKDGSNASAGLVIAPMMAAGSGTGGLRLDAKGNVELRGWLRASKVLVDHQWWPDFVFKADYPLMRLSDLEEFIRKHGHLPEVPSAETVLQDGADLGEMDAVLLKKVEELTLYILDLEKRLRDLESQK